MEWVRLFCFITDTAFNRFAIVAYIHRIVPPSGVDQLMRPLRSCQKNKNKNKRKETKTSKTRRKPSCLSTCYLTACGNCAAWGTLWEVETVVIVLVLVLPPRGGRDCLCTKRAFAPPEMIHRELIHPELLRRNQS
jgi:hypothetical protein